MIVYCSDCDSAPAWECGLCQACYQCARRQRLKTARYVRRCSVAGCTGYAVARGLCNRDYLRWQRGKAA